MAGRALGEGLCEGLGALKQTEHSSKQMKQKSRYKGLGGDLQAQEGLCGWLWSLERQTKEMQPERLMECSSVG